MSSEFNEKNYSYKMDKSISSFKKDISTLRTGRANTNMLDTIKVDVYGQLMPIEQLGTVSVPEARLISIQVWDKSNTTLIESAIQKSELGINPQTDGQIIRLRIPDLTEERRKDLIKILKNMGEKSKVSIRNIRREANEELKKMLKSKEIGEDEGRKAEDDIQTITNEMAKTAFNAHDNASGAWQRRRGLARRPTVSISSGSTFSVRVLGIGRRARATAELQRADGATANFTTSRPLSAQHGARCGLGKFI